VRDFARWVHCSQTKGERRVRQAPGEHTQGGTRFRDQRFHASCFQLDTTHSMCTHWAITRHVFGNVVLERFGGSPVRNRWACTQFAVAKFPGHNMATTRASKGLKALCSVPGSYAQPPRPSHPSPRATKSPSVTPHLSRAAPGLGPHYACSQPVAATDVAE
jgi:hypothetical protein